MRRYSGLALAIFLVRTAPAQPGPLPSSQYCEMIAGYGVGLTQFAAQRTLRQDLIIESLRLCPEQFVSVANNFPPNSVVGALSGPERRDALTASLATSAVQKVASTPSLGGLPLAKSLVAALSGPAGGPSGSGALVRV